MGAHAEVKDRAAPRILLGAMLLLVLCVVSGRPQVFSDTKSYYALGHEAASVFQTPRPAQASAEILRGRPLAAVEAASETRLAYTVSASRSPYWSVLFYVAVELGSAWLVVVLQSLVAAVIVWTAAAAFGVRHAYLPIVAGLALLSSLPVQVMFLMPDLFAGLAILAALVLVVARDRLTRGAAVTLWIVMAASALFHTSHLLLIATLGAGTLVVSILRRHRAVWRPGAAMLAAAAVGSGRRDRLSACRADDPSPADLRAAVPVGAADRRRPRTRAAAPRLRDRKRMGVVRLSRPSADRREHDPVER